MCYLQRTKNQHYRFSLLVQELQSAETTDYRSCLLAFMNCIVAACNDLSRRVKIRNEFIGEWACISARPLPTKCVQTCAQFEVF